MNAFVYGTARTSEQTEAIVADLKRAGFANPHVSALTNADVPPFGAVGLNGRPRSNGTRICVHVANPNQRDAAQDIFHQHDADDITTDNESHATTH